MTVDQTPLRGFAERFTKASHASAGALELTEEPLWQQVNVRTDRGFAGSLTDTLGGLIPLEPNTVTMTATGHIVWLGPDEWLALCPVHRTDLESALRAAASGPISVVDVSAAGTVIRLAGPAARDILAHGCGLDLDAAKFPPGRCAQTRLALANVVLIAPAEQPADFDRSPSLLILVRPSFAPYLATWLLDAATEYCAGVVGLRTSRSTSGP